MPSEVNICADDCRLALSLDRWEFPELTSGADANWIIGVAELSVEAPAHSNLRLPVHIRSDELQAFRDELSDLLASKSETATLGHMEDQFGASILSTDGKYEMQAFVAEHAGARLQTNATTIEGSQLTATLADLWQATGAFAVRGDPYD